MSAFPFSQPSPNEPESVHTAWRTARFAWHKELEATALLADATRRQSSPEARKYLEEGIAYAARYADETATAYVHTIRATRRTEPRAIPA